MSKHKACKKTGVLDRSFTHNLVIPIEAQRSGGTCIDRSFTYHLVIPTEAQAGVGAQRRDLHLALPTAEQTCVFAKGTASAVPKATLDESGFSP